MQLDKFILLIVTMLVKADRFLWWVRREVVARVRKQGPRRKTPFSSDLQRECQQFDLYPATPINLSKTQYAPSNSFCSHDPFPCQTSYQSILRFPKWKIRYTGWFPEACILCVATGLAKLAQLNCRKPISGPRLTCTHL